MDCGYFLGWLLCDVGFEVVLEDEIVWLCVFFGVVD